MNRIKNLIKEKCPSGVPRKKLDELLSFQQPTKFLVKNTKYDDSYKTPVLTAGQTLVLGYTNETEGIYKADKSDPVIIFDDFTTSFHWIDFDFKAKSSAMKMLKPKNDNINFRFIYHMMKCIKHKPGDHSRQWISKYSQIEIPVPPVEVQNEIVRILDNFTSLTAELTAELTARKKQYEFYKNQLFENIDLKYTTKLEKVAKIIRGGSFQKRDFAEVGKPCIHYGQIYTYFGPHTLETIKNIPEKIFNNSKHASKNDIIMAVTSENLEDVCKCTAWLGNEDIAVSGHTAVIQHNQDAKFLSYYFHTDLFFKQKSKIAHGTKVIEVTPKSLLNIDIPIPLIEEQKKIASKIDILYQLCCDLSKGLPAEIEARKKQYEYYREEIFSLLN